MLPSTAYVAAGAVFAALITSSISFVNLVISKDQKTSEFRQAWIDALREDLSEMIGHMFNISALCDYYIDKYKDNKDLAIEKLVKNIGKDIAAVSGLYHRIILRLNAEHDKKLIEAVTTLHDMLSAIETNMVKLDELDKITTEVTSLSQKLLKKEWKRVKRGEPTFYITKYVSLAVAGTFIVFYTLNKTKIVHAITTSVNTEESKSQPETKASPLSPINKRIKAK